MSTPLGRRFGLLLGSSATSNVADGLGRVAVPLIAAALTRDPVLVAAASSLTFVPWLLFALVGGVLVDRVDRRRAMVVANVARAALLAGFAVALVTGVAGIGLLYVVAFGFGVAETVYDLAARAVLPSVVERDRLDRANGYLEVTETGTGFVSAPLAGALFVLAAAAPVAAQAAAYLVSAALLATMAGRYRVPRSTADGARVSVRTEMADGLRWLWRHALLRRMTLVLASLGLVTQGVVAVLVLYVLDDLGIGEIGFGLLLACAGVGGLLAGLGTPLLTARVRRRRVLAGALFVQSGALPVIAVVVHPVVAGVGLAVFTGCVVVTNVVMMSLRQSVIPPELFGRVQGAIRTVAWGAIPVGGILGGVLSGLVTVRVWYVIAGAVFFVIALATAVVLRRHGAPLDALDAPARSPVSAS